jgi:hypothetical protein
MSQAATSTVVFPPGQEIGPRLKMASSGLIPDSPRLWLRNSAVCTLPQRHFSYLSPSSLAAAR